MKQPKFILTNTGCFRLGMVEMHKDLLQHGEECYGGGYYEFDWVSNRLILTGKSYDFGPPKWHWLDKLRVPATYRGLQLVYVPHNSWEDDVNVADEVNIEYYE